MRQTSTRISLGLVGVSILIAGAILFISSARSADSGPNFKIGIRFCDHGCSAEIGRPQYTGSVNLVEQGTMPSNFAADANAYDPDGASPLLALSGTGKILHNFQFCFQLADHMRLDGSGNVSAASEFGTIQCTPPAINADGSGGGGWSPWVADANAYDFDGGKVEIRTLGKLPTGVAITDVQFGLKFSDNGAGNQQGAPQFTKWLSELTNTQPESIGPAAMDANGYDPDWMAGYLGVKVSISSCQEAIPVDQQTKVLSQRAGIRLGLGDSGAPTGLLTGPANSVIRWMRLKHGFNDRQVEGVESSIGQCLSGACTSSSAVGLTDPRITIQSLTFYVWGVGTGDQTQPQVLMTVRGTMQASVSRTVDFTIQTSATQRVLDL